MHLRESNRWSCKKHSSVSQSTTESEIISLAAGFRSDGIGALDFLDLVIGSVTSVSTRKLVTLK